MLADPSPEHATAEKGQVWGDVPAFSFGTLALQHLQDGTVLLTHYATIDDITHPWVSLRDWLSPGQWLDEDLGTQIGPMVSLDLYRKNIRPVHQRFVDLGKAHDLPVMMHSCGSSSWAYDDFIEMGIVAVDTLQPEATNMAPEYLKKTFGDRLAFHGCISTAGPVATGTVAQTIDYCRRTLDIMMPDGGYCFSPTHSLQDNSPTENVVAMYETARKHGTY